MLRYLIFQSIGSGSVEPVPQAILVCLNICHLPWGLLILTLSPPDFFPAERCDNLRLRVYRTFSREGALKDASKCDLGGPSINRRSCSQNWRDNNAGCSIYTSLPKYFAHELEKGHPVQVPRFRAAQGVCHRWNACMVKLKEGRRFESQALRLGGRCPWLRIACKRQLEVVTVPWKHTQALDTFSLERFWNWRAICHQVFPPLRVVRQWREDAAGLSAQAPSFRSLSLCASHSLVMVIFDRLERSIFATTTWIVICTSQVTSPHEIPSDVHMDLIWQLTVPSNVPGNKVKTMRLVLERLS